MGIGRLSEVSPEWLFQSRELTGTELCEVEGCDGSCDLWHVL